MKRLSNESSRVITLRKNHLDFGFFLVSIFRLSQGFFFCLQTRLVIAGVYEKQRNSDSHCCSYSRVKFKCFLYTLTLFIRPGSFFYM